MASFLTARTDSRWVAGTKLRTVMSSSMRARSGLMGFSLIGVSCLEVGVLDPSILKTEGPPRYCTPIRWLAHREPSAPDASRAQRSPARAGSFFSAQRTTRSLVHRALKKSAWNL